MFNLGELSEEVVVISLLSMPMTINTVSVRLRTLKKGDNVKL